jgi:hypothetical protein
LQTGAVPIIFTGLPVPTVIKLVFPAGNEKIFAGSPEHMNKLMKFMFKKEKR